VAVECAGASRGSPKRTAWKSLEKTGHFNGVDTWTSAFAKRGLRVALLYDETEVAYKQDTDEEFLTLYDEPTPTPYNTQHTTHIHAHTHTRARHEALLISY
jgi:hypothetical protein